MRLSRRSRAIVLLAFSLLCCAVAVPVAAPAHAETLQELTFEKKLKLAKVGDEDAQLAVAIGYEEGKDTQASAVEAAKWYKQAALQGNVDAQFRLARLVAKGAKGLAKNQDMSLKLYESAANGGQAEAQNAMGEIYRQGKGVTADPKKAAEWYRKAAENNNAPAQNSLGLLYLDGKGVARDLREAARYFELAAGQGDGWGLNNLGGMYEMGWGVPKDPVKAASYYKQAVAKGVVSAKKNLIRVEPAAATQ
jgi:uncharacterized protein